MLHSLWVETRGSETPASRTFYSRFLSPSIGVPASLFYFYSRMLRNIANFSPFLPLPANLGIPLPALSPPASPTPPSPILPGSQPPVPLHKSGPYHMKMNLYQRTVLHINGYNLPLGEVCVTRGTHVIIITTSTVKGAVA